MALINDVLEMSKIEAGRITLNPVTFDFHSILTDLETMFQCRINTKKICLNIERTGDVPRILYSDEGKVRQVLINVIGNAMKFTDNGSITISAFLKKTKNGILLSAQDLNPKQKITISVEDTGCGIAPEEIDKVFNQFEQTESGRNKGTGTGLGMTISRQYARMMGGDLTVESTLGKGSVFTLNSRRKSWSEKELEITSIPLRRVERIAPGAKVIAYSGC